MRTFLVRRLIFGLFSLFAATALVFALSRAAGDPLLLYAKPGGYGVSQGQMAALRTKLGLDKPEVIQYFMWLGNVLHGDLGKTLDGRQQVTHVIRQKIGATLALGSTAWIFATLVGVPLGILSAVKRGTIWDYAGRLIALFGQGLPQFWVGIVAVLIFAVTLHWLPAGTRAIDKPFFPDQIEHLILPALTLGWAPMAAYLRLTRSSMLEVLDSEFVTLARAKGTGATSVVWKHAFRNALIAPVTVSALVLVSFIDGAILVEDVFGWPGIGQLAVQSIYNNDFPLITGVVLMFAVMFVLGSFIADILYVVIDPRIRYS